MTNPPAGFSFYLMLITNCVRSRCRPVTEWVETSSGSREEVEVVYEVIRRHLSDDLVALELGESLEDFSMALLVRLLQDDSLILVRGKGAKDLKFFFELEVPENRSDVLGSHLFENRSQSRGIHLSHGEHRQQGFVERRSAVPGIG